MSHNEVQTHNMLYRSEGEKFSVLLFENVLVHVTCDHVFRSLRVWIESRSPLCITLLFIVRTNPRYEKNPLPPMRQMRGERGNELRNKKKSRKKHMCARENG